jgi:hypothetical protein
MVSSLIKVKRFLRITGLTTIHTSLRVHTRVGRVIENGKKKSKRIAKTELQ